MSMFIWKISDYRFEWAGGAYVEIFVGDDKTAFDLINVYDYELGKPAYGLTEVLELCKDRANLLDSINCCAECADFYGGRG